VETTVRERTGAVELDGREAELLGNIRVLDFLGVLERETLDALGHIRAGGDSAPAAERLELHVGYYSALVDTDLELHHVAAPGDNDGLSQRRPGGDSAGGRGHSRRRADEAGADVRVRLGHRADLEEDIRLAAAWGGGPDRPRQEGGRTFRGFS
jgi:hypothetical protein